MMQREAALRASIKSIADFNYTFVQDNDLDWKKYKVFLAKIKKEQYQHWVETSKYDMYCDKPQVISLIKNKNE
jgi:hypothetical protein